MSIRFLAGLRFVVLAGAAACGRESVSPSNLPPARLDPVAPVVRTATVGSSIPGALVVKVTDAAGRPVSDVAVAFAVTMGNGSTSPRLALTGPNGEATSVWTLGTVVGPNEVTAWVTGIESRVRFTATGTAGPVAVITLSPQRMRVLASVDTARITVRSLDAFGNVAVAAPVLVARDPSLISVDTTGFVRVIRRGAGTYVVATAGGKSDSVLVTVLAAGQSICTAVANPMPLAVGQVVTDLSGSGFCVHGAAGSEYAVVPFYSSSIPSASIQLEVLGQGLAPLPLPRAALSSIAPRRRSSGDVPLVPDDAFERRLRDRERAGSAMRRTGGMRTPRPRASLRSEAPVVPVVGDVVKYNVNNNDFCDRPDLRTGKVVAVSDRAVIVADTANPPGGFTDAEYRSIAVTFDTLVDPVDRAAFGAPSDIDGNGRAVIFFTRAVNELSASGSGGVVLGFFYRRDLYPRTGDGACVGSNAAEMMYILVPDTGGVVNGNRRSKSQVLAAASGTAAHEYQHLINASRRRYVNNAGDVFEERWLDEGLAHIAEDLNFWRASGRSPRANVDAGIFGDPRTTAAYSMFASNNLLRYRTYLQRTETQSPIGFDSTDDDLQTRGAIWSFLRFAADHLSPEAENAFWSRLVNSTTSGVANLTSALGAAPWSLMRDWAISVYLDDNAPNVDPRFQQTSWNTRSVLTNGGTSLAFPLVPRSLADDAASQVLLAANGVAFMRFSVANGQDALVTVTASGQPLPPGVQLAVVRTR